MTDDLDRFLTQLRSEVDEFLSRDFLGFIGGGFGRIRLRGRVPLPRYVAARYGSFLDRPYRGTGDTVERIHEALLGHLRDRLDPATVHHDVQQVRASGRIPIPQSVMNQLEVPHPLACLRVEAQETVFKEAGARPPSAIKIAVLSLAGH